MDRDKATTEAMRLKAYFPYRVVGIIEQSPGEWEAQARLTMAAFNNAARKGKPVFIIG